MQSYIRSLASVIVGNISKLQHYIFMSNDLPKWIVHFCVRVVSLLSASASLFFHNYSVVHSVQNYLWGNFSLHRLKSFIACLQEKAYRIKYKKMKHHHYSDTLILDDFITGSPSSIATHPVQLIATVQMLPLNHIFLSASTENAFDDSNVLIVFRAPIKLCHYNWHLRYEHWHNWHLMPVGCRFGRLTCDASNWVIVPMFHSMVVLPTLATFQNWRENNNTYYSKTFLGFLSYNNNNFLFNIQFLVAVCDNLYLFVFLFFSYLFFTCLDYNNDLLHTKNE